MHLDDYQNQSRRTAIYPHIDDNLQYPALGLAGETGEVCDIIKKVERDDAGILTEGKESLLFFELGDTLWYLAQVASEAGFSLDEIARANIDKLERRKAEGTLGGSGDNR